MERCAVCRQVIDPVYKDVLTIDTFVFHREHFENALTFLNWLLKKNKVIVDFKRGVATLLFPGRGLRYCEICNIAMDTNDANMQLISGKWVHTDHLSYSLIIFSELIKRKFLSLVLVEDNVYELKRKTDEKA